jgi:hypothetical protein
MHKTPEITRLIHENLWIVLSFALARPVVTGLINDHFEGDLEYLRGTVHDYAEIRADRALLEMAVQLRTLDDREGLGDYLRMSGAEPLGYVVQGDDTDTDLHFRDMTNKILHAEAFDWRLRAPHDSSVICLPYEKYRSRWIYAEIQLVKVMSLVGQLVY